MTIDDSENGWDSLAEDLGLQPEPTTARAEPAAPVEPEPPPRRPVSERKALPHRNDTEDAGDDFGLGVVEPTSPARPHAALYDPGPNAVEDQDEIGEAPAPLEDDEDEEGEEDEATGPAGEEQPGGKKRRRRRRRKKKAGGPTEDATAAPVEDEAEEAGVEQGEAPAEVEDEEEAYAPSAVDEEMDAEVAHPRPQYKVMTWAELVSKLYRPG